MKYVSKYLFQNINERFLKRKMQYRKTSRVIQKSNCEIWAIKTKWNHYTLKDQKEKREKEKEDRQRHREKTMAENFLKLMNNMKPGIQEVLTHAYRVNSHILAHLWNTFIVTSWLGLNQTLSTLTKPSWHIKLTFICNAPMAEGIFFFKFNYMLCTRGSLQIQIYK